MASEAIPMEMYSALLDLDAQIHTVLAQGKSTAGKISLQELQEHISDSLPEEIPDTTPLVRKMREKSYG